MRTYTDLRPTVADPRDWTIPRLLRRRARTHGDQTYLDAPEDGVRLTYSEILAAAESTAQGLLSAGLSPGDRVLVMARNRGEAVVASYGILLAGLVEVPLNTAYHGTILAHQVGIAAPQAAIVDPEFADRFPPIRRGPLPLKTVYLFPDEGAASAEQVLADAGWRVRRFEQLTDHSHVGTLPDPRPSDLAAILFTSGTTGPSKGVMMPHGQLYFFADEGVSMTRLTDRDAYLAMTPMFHANAKVLVGFGALVAGARFVLRSRFSASRWLEWVRTDGATVTNLVGVMMEFVRRRPPTAFDRNHRLRCIRAGPTSGDAGAFATRFEIDSIVEAFGSTECSSPILTPYDARGHRPAGAAGLAVADWFDVRLVDATTGRDVPPGAPGELILRPRAPWIVSTGYFRMPEATLASRRDLWFHTGDALRRDTEGWFTFVDRLSDTLRRRGENISSYEVEAPIRQHLAVADCAVVAVPSELPGGEDEVLAVVVPTVGETLRPDDLWAWCEKHLPAFVVPRYLRVIDHLPKTPSEKVRKSLLREEGVTPDTLERSSPGTLSPRTDSG